MIDTKLLSHRFYADRKDPLKKKTVTKKSILPPPTKPASEARMTTTKISSSAQVGTDGGKITLKNFSG